jgi:uncharacterized lipoprotein YddW (UPF0748 family)
MSHIRKIVLICSSLVLLSGITLSTNNCNQVTKPEIRGTWIPLTNSIQSKSSLAKTISRVQELNLNTVYVNTFSKGYTIYPSSVKGVNQLKKLKDQNRDLLQETIELSKPKKIKTFAWFEYGFMTFKDNPIITQKPNWIALNKDGGIYARDQTIWLNPINPEVQNYITNIILEKIQKYDLDGIQFDDHMALNSELGYDKYTIDLYQLETGRIAPLVATTPNPLEDPNWKHWLDWRSDKITKYFKRLTSAIKNQKPKLNISIAVNYKALAYKYYCQKWNDWLTNVDELIVQNYTTNDTDFNRNISTQDIVNAKKRIPVSVALGLIVKDKQVTNEQLLYQAGITRKNGLNGLNFWFVDHLEEGNQKNSRTNTVKKLFPTYTNRSS